MPEYPSVAKISKLMDEIREESDKDTKAAKRRMRIALSEMSKLCKEARKEILAAMK